MKLKGYYSIIQYIPDPGRLEAANVGVLLVIPTTGFKAISLDENNLRVQKFFPGTDLEQLYAAELALISSIRERLDVAHNEKILATLTKKLPGKQANNLRMTPIRPLKIVDGDPHKCLLQLQNDLVLEPK